MLIECQVQAGMEKKSKRGLVIDLKQRIVACCIPVLILIHVLVEDSAAAPTGIGFFVGLDSARTGFLSL